MGCAQARNKNPIPIQIPSKSECIYELFRGCPVEQPVSNLWSRVSVGGSLSPCQAGACLHAVHQPMPHRRRHTGAMPQILPLQLPTLALGWLVLCDLCRHTRACPFIVRFTSLCPTMNNKASALWSPRLYYMPYFFNQAVA
jgi:hypothetical protein